MAASISHFITVATKFSCCSSDKKLSLSGFRSLSPFFSLSFASLPPTSSFSRSYPWCSAARASRARAPLSRMLFIPLIILITKMSGHFGIIGMGLNWFKSYLTNSNALSTITCHLKKIITCGVPPAINPRGTFGYIMHQRFA